MSKSTIFKNLKNDIPASIVVFFVALPLCLGIALASGAPLFSGLIAGIVGGILVGSAGLILTFVMCNAMNRSLSNVIFGAARLFFALKKQNMEDIS